jgi:hypothetical protein
MPRKREYADNAERQRTYRARENRSRRKDDTRFCKVEGCPGLRSPGATFCKLHQPRLPFPKR